MVLWVVIREYSGWHIRLTRKISSSRKGGDTNPCEGCVKKGIRYKNLCDINHTDPSAMNKKAAKTSFSSCPLRVAGKAAVSQGRDTSLYFGK